MVQPADELVSAYPTHAASTNRAAQVSSATPVEMTTAQPSAAITRKRIGGNSSGSYRDSGHNDRDFMQHRFLHGSSLFC